MQSPLLELERQFFPSPLTRINEPFFTARKVELWLKRDDLLHPIISGNKWRKLKYCLHHALALKKTTLISMGGAYSNHLHALAFVGKTLSLQTKAFIRGEQPAQLNPTLRDLVENGMELEFISRSAYRQLRNFKAWDALPDLKSDAYWIPEGGATELALIGVGEILAEINQDYNVLCTACGTATTLAGLIKAAPKEKQLLGFAALKGADFLNTDVHALLKNQSGLAKNWQLKLDAHCGGFGKTTPALLDFIRDFEQRQQIPLEPIYTGKMLFALYGLIAEGFFPAGQKIIALHTGGLQGKRR